MVLAFHEKFGFTLNRKPTIIATHLSQVRYRHTRHELVELKLAMVNENFVSIADAIADLIYFLYGTAVAYGIDMEPVFAEIHRSNMSKDSPDPVQYVDAKAVKGENYSPPDLGKIIDKQMK